MRSCLLGAGVCSQGVFAVLLVSSSLLQGTAGAPGLSHSSSPLFGGAEDSEPLCAESQGGAGGWEEPGWGSSSGLGLAGPCWVGPGDKALCRAA